jgi:hypothetical protein
LAATTDHVIDVIVKQFESLLFACSCGDAGHLPPLIHVAHVLHRLTCLGCGILTQLLLLLLHQAAQVI